MSITPCPNIALLRSPTWGFPLTKDLSDGAAITKGGMVAEESGISHNTDGACASPIPIEKCVHPTRYLNCGSSQESQQWSKPLCAALCTAAQGKDSMLYTWLWSKQYTSSTPCRNGPITGVSARLWRKVCSAGSCGHNNSQEEEKEGVLSVCGELKGIIGTYTTLKTVG